MNTLNQRPSQTARVLPTMGQSFRRIHLTVMLVFLLCSGLSLSALSMYVLRSYAENNIQLIATSVSYSAHGAVLKGDAETAKNLLSDIGTHSDFSAARIYDAHQKLLVSWQMPGANVHRGLSAAVAEWLFPKPVSAPIIHHHKEIGRVWIHGDATRVLHYLWQALQWLGGSLLITAFLAFYLSHRMHAGILQGLKNIASVTHDVRKRRAFSLRVPSASIAELDKLSGDFNALLDELDQWQRHLTRENSSLAHQALHDGLTGLPNRKAFERRLQALLLDPHRRQQVSVLFIDGNHFKQVNDRYGHAAGDRVLTVTAQRLQARLGKNDMVARLGGDEFAVLLTSAGEEDEVAQVARRIIRAMQPPVQLPDGTRVVQSLSVGAAMAKHHAVPEALVAQADAAMYHIKQQGGGWYLSPLHWGQEPRAIPPQRLMASR
ncbi:GGDEF domain-containing protein [Erwinia persicina]|uniref:diguanylate cyclase domain-containing protein n=1 Tax=Erwinia persicina TaxID=55211 RepID=UPI000E49D284|nr:diguanylate cyclase [Erwinia persicina]AXU96726.1 GGDEF domain-containing protein [Erwinia persicina]